MKGNLLSFPFISFSESGLFNGLRPIQIKKIRLNSHGTGGPIRIHSFSDNSIHQSTVSHISDFDKHAPLIAWSDRTGALTATYQSGL
jgi:hypothetical protein